MYVRSPLSRNNGRLSGIRSSNEKCVKSSKWTVEAEGFFMQKKGTHVCNVFTRQYICVLYVCNCPIEEWPTHRNAFICFLKCFIIPWKKLSVLPMVSAVIISATIRRYFSLPSRFDGIDIEKYCLSSGALYLLNYIGIRKFPLKNIFVFFNYYFACTHQKST